MDNLSRRFVPGQEALPTGRTGTASAQSPPATVLSRTFFCRSQADLLPQQSHEKALTRAAIV